MTRPLPVPRPGPRPRPPVVFLTVQEVAVRFRVSKMTVYRLIDAGELKAIRIGRSFRVPAPAIDEYLRRAGADLS